MKQLFVKKKRKFFHVSTKQIIFGKISGIETSSSSIFLWILIQMKHVLVTFCVNYICFEYLLNIFWEVFNCISCIQYTAEERLKNNLLNPMTWTVLHVWYQRSCCWVIFLFLAMMLPGYCGHCYMIIYYLNYYSDLPRFWLQQSIITDTRTYGT